MSDLKDEDNTEVLTPAACGVSGVAVIICLNERCDLTQSAVIPALEHDFSILDENDAELHPADCANPAYYVMHCANDGCVATEAAIVPTVDGVTNEALGHSWAISEVAEPTCVSAGSVISECTRCAVTAEAVSGSALGHDVTTVSVEPTCQDDGYTAQKCTRCDYEGEHTDIVPKDADAHVVSEGAVIKPASCKTGGVAKLVCKHCGKAMGYKSLLASHAWGEATVETPATCTQAGVQAMTCTVDGCGEATKAAIEATGHTEKEQIDVPNTCGKDGKKSIICTVCDEVIEKDIVIPATGKHTFDDDQFIDPTCTEPGKVGTICTGCGKVDGDYFEFGEPLGHEWDEENIEVVSPAACEVSGAGVIHCTNDSCEATKSAVLPALEHEWEYAEDGSDYHEADCEHGDYVTSTCANCGTTNIEETGISGALGHNWVTKEAVEATCVSGGYVIMECTRDACEATMEAAKTEPLGHKWEEKVIPPDCTNDGYTADVCKNCGAEGEHTNIVPSSEELHVAVSGAVLKPATCKAGGVRKLVCKGCNKGMGYETIPAAEHTWGDAQVTTPATCTEPGEQTVTCDVCGKTETQVIPAKGHDVDTETELVDDNATAVYYKCKNCEYAKFIELFPNYEGIDWITPDHTNNHELFVVTDEAVEPTETTAGKTEGSHCGVCGEVIVAQETIPATGQICDHEYGDYEVVEVADGENMLKYTCTKCGHSYTEACDHEYGDPEVVEVEGEWVFRYECGICHSIYTEPM